jgi:RecJ-like exonuclease
MDATADYAVCPRCHGTGDQPILTRCPRCDGSGEIDICWATGFGQREVHDRKRCSHYAR